MASPSRPCSHRPRCANTWVCRWISASASTWAARPRPAWCGGPRRRWNWDCATRCWPWCPVRCMLPQSERTPSRRSRGWYRRVEQRIRLAAGRVRDPVRQCRAERARTRRSLSATRRDLGYDAAALAKIAVDQRTNACAHPGAVFHGKPITVDDVLASPMIADPIHMLETVMRVHGRRRRSDRQRRHRPSSAAPSGVDQGLRRTHRLQDTDLRRRPADAPRSRAPPSKAFAMAGLSRSDVDMASIYDCYTITVLMTPGGRRLLRQGRRHGVGQPSTI